MESHVVPAAEGRAFHVGEGGRIRIVTPEGRQAADFFAFCAGDVGEWLSPMHTWVWSLSVKPRPGDTLLSRFRQPMLDFVEDGAGGMHDMMLAACDQARYAQFGFDGYHRSCSENLEIAMRGLGHELSVIPQPINFFTNTHIDEEGRLTSPPNQVPAGGYVELEARADLICGVSSCPFDLAREGWSINDPGGPTELIVELR